MNAPKISVIVPVYNAEKYIHRCIDSILVQTFTDFELLLIDDGSEDNSGIICDYYAEYDHRIRVNHKKNGGPSSARNLGLEYSRGEWIVFVDSDDWVDVDYLNVLYSHCSEQNIVMCVAGYTSNEKKNHLRQGKYYTIDMVKRYLLFDNVRNEVWGTIFHNSENVRFNDKIKIGEDLIFLIEFCSNNKGEVVLIENTPYHYEIREGSLMDGRTEENCVFMADTISQINYKQQENCNWKIYLKANRIIIYWSILKLFYFQNNTLSNQYNSYFVENLRDVKGVLRGKTYNVIRLYVKYPVCSYLFRYFCKMKQCYKRITS